MVIRTKLTLAWCAAVFVAGVLVRLTGVVPQAHEKVTRTEPVNIAISLATTGRFADAYGDGVGPTAHAAPLYPLLLSLVFRVFGMGGRGDLAMSITGSVAAALSFALLPALGMVSGIGLRIGALAGMAGALLPVNFWVQTSGVFEAPFTACAFIILCTLVCRIWASASFTAREAIVFGLTAGVGCLLSPVLIPVLAAWSVVSVVRFQQDLRRLLAFVAISAVCCLCVMAPWAIRNGRVLGSFIWTRSNLGLELQVSNNSFVTPDEEANVRMPGWAKLHPFTNSEERAKVRTLGEVAYERQKWQQALAWVTSHKLAFLRLTAERFRLFWLPVMLRWWQSAFEIALSLTAFAGLFLLFRERNASAWIFGSAMIAYPAIYYIIEVSPRYRFPLECMLFLLSAKSVAFAIVFASRLTGRFPSNPSASSARPIRLTPSDWEAQPPLREKL
jgi:hypothetical protein